MAEIYKIVAFDSDGRRLESYAMPDMYRMFSRSMMEEYGNVEVTPMAFSDLPSDILEQVKKSNAAIDDETPAE